MSEESAFKVVDDGVVLTPAHKEARHLVDALVSEESAQRTSDASVLLPHAELADLQPWELAALGLPPAAPFRLEIRGTGAISSPGFRLHAQLRTHDGRKVIGAKRNGTILTVGRRSYVLLNPLFQVLAAAEAFDEASAHSIDERFQRWADIQSLLPGDAVVDQQLQTINLVRADGFSLDVAPDGSFDPVPLSRPISATMATDESPTLPDEPLPESYQKTFADRFRQLETAKGHYALGGGWYIAVPESTRRALQVVHEKQRSSPAERRAFLANPQGQLNEALSDTQSDAELEQLFVEMPQFLSSRVQCLGEWHPKLGAYVQGTGNNWFPDELAGGDGEPTLGVVVGNAHVSFIPSEAPDIVSRLEEALQRGEPTIEIAGNNVEATEEALATFQRFVKTPDDQSAPDDPAKEDATTNQQRLVPILIDNLEETGYIAEPRPVEGEPGGLPSVLKTRELFPHQRDGVCWLQSAWVGGAPGGLLADDMGLGKTLQCLTFLAWLQEQMDAELHPAKPFLIVAPTGLLRNWEAEADTHLSGIGLGERIRAYGTELRNLTQKSVRQRTKEIQGCDWALTTYETLRDRIEVFLPVDWAVVAFDECQKIKNPGSRLTEMAKSLKADFTLAITGTPVENSLSDLWSVMDACRPGFLGSLKEFRQQYQKPAEESGDSSVGRDLRAKLEQEVTPPAILRRMKLDHLAGLPEKQAREVRVPMEGKQAEAYAALVTSAANARGQKGAVLGALQEMRRVSLVSEPFAESGMTDDTVASSARLRATVDILEGIRERGEKALIFVEYLDVQVGLVAYLQERFGLAHPPARISGKVSGTARQRLVDDFQSRPDGEFDVMLLSPKAGGVGITLTAANHVIHLSRWWNPAVEDQCTDRVYRIGQERPVNIHYPMAVHPHYGDHSFDLNLHRLLEKKRELSHSVLAPPNVSDDELASLFGDSVDASAEMG